MRYKGVIFDCDGVMIDSTDANREFYNLILEHYGLPRMRKDQEEYSFMATSEEALRRLLPESLHKDIPLMGRRVVNYRDRIMPLVKIFPGFLDFVRVLHKYGVRMAVLTNRTSRGMQAVLDFFGLPPYFWPVVTASDGAAKPSPDGGLRILEAWHLAPCDVLYVGDSDVDRRTALALGTDFAALAPTHPLEGTYVVTGYADLERRLGLEAVPDTGTDPAAPSSPSDGKARTVGDSPAGTTRQGH